jgi:hypothetical protein
MADKTQYSWLKFKTRNHLLKPPLSVFLVMPVSRPFSPNTKEVLLPQSDQQMTGPTGEPVLYVSSRRINLAQEVFIGKVL